MSEYFEIAYAAVSKQLCLFTGTGFSKSVSENAAPSWQGLLEEACDKCENPAALRETLFPSAAPNLLSLEEAAQVIAIELERQGISLHDEIATQINTLELKGNNSILETFLKNQSFRAVTTNYDKLLEQLSGDEDCQSLAPGLPVPRSSARVKVYHVHGSTDVPENMVVTSDDYFRFLSQESYFSRKLSTVLHENTVVILGYSLADTNLKAILSDYRKFSRSHVIGSNIFLVSRSAVDGHIKDYYSYCYGIRVLDGLEISELFNKINKELPDAEKRFSRSLSNIKNVVKKNKTFKDDHLKIEGSFYEIVASLGAVGFSINDPEVVIALGKIIEQKVALTKETGAWPQYEHLARWLIYLASILELKGSSIEAAFLKAALRSMTTMSRSLKLGYSWHAHRSWDSGWDSIIAANRTLIRKHIVANTDWPDALAIAGRG